MILLRILFLLLMPFMALIAILCGILIFPAFISLIFICLMIAEAIESFVSWIIGKPIPRSWLDAIWSLEDTFEDPTDVIFFACKPIDMAYNYVTNKP